MADGTAAKRPRRRPSASAPSASAGPVKASDEADRVAAILAKVEADLAALASSGIDAITSPVTQASFLLHGAQEALREREERYRLAIRVTGCVIWDWDVGTGQVIWAGPLEEVFGCCPHGNRSTTQWWKERVHPEDYRRVRDHFYLMQNRKLGSSRQRKDEPWDIMYRFRRADRSYITVHGVHSLCGATDTVSGHPPGGAARGFADKAGLRIIGAITDITQRKLDEDNLRRNEAHLARAQRLTLLGSFDFDGVSGELRLSAEAYRVLGVDSETFPNTVEAIRALINPVDLEGVIGLRQLIGLRDAGAATEACEFRMLGAGGQVRVVRRECDPVFDAAGRISGFFGTFQDVTKSHAAEQQRRELGEKLMQAQKMEALGTLAGGIAHDLNNTLVPVVSLAEVVRRNLPEDSADRGLLEVVRQSGERARDLVGQILTFTRQRTTDRTELDLAVFLRENMRLIRASVLRNIDIVEQIEAVPLILADAIQVHQVILNLITNAAQAIDGGTGTITVELAVSGSDAGMRGIQPSGGWLRLSVSDSGCGMSEALQRRIFEPFFTTKKVGSGTGLGLSVVHGIVADHGGHIDVTSRPGVGTRFDIFLPGLPAGPTDEHRKAHMS